MILIPIITVCTVLILVGLIAGKIHGQSLSKMLKEVFIIGRSSIGPIIAIILVTAIILLGLIFFWRGDWIN